MVSKAKQSSGNALVAPISSLTNMSITSVPSSLFETGSKAGMSIVPVYFVHDQNYKSFVGHATALKQKQKIKNANNTAKWGFK